MVYVPGSNMTEQDIMVYTSFFAAITSMLISLIQQVRLSRCRVIDIGPLHIERDVPSPHECDVPGPHEQLPTK